MSNRIALIGANGQLGTDIAKVAEPGMMMPLTHQDFDITEFARAREKLQALAPTHVINTAAYHRVDDCEGEDQKAFLVNALAVKELALTCNAIDAVLVHISTDYVFDGEKRIPYTETDLPHPQSVYALSKHMGELYVQAYAKKYFIIRSCGLYGTAGCRASGGLNFVELMLKLAREKGEVSVVTDQVVTPTYTLPLAKKILELSATEAFGLYHITPHGECSWYEFAAKIFALTQTKVTLHKTTSAVFKSRARRPSYSVLDNQRLCALGIDDLPRWDEALSAYLTERATHRAPSESVVKKV